MNTKQHALVLCQYLTLVPLRPATATTTTTPTTTAVLGAACAAALSAAGCVAGGWPSRSVKPSKSRFLLEC